MSSSIKESIVGDEKQDIPRAGAMMRNNFGSNLEFLVLSTLLLAISSIPLSVVVLAAILRRGSTTVFEPSDSRVGWVEGPTDRGTMNLIWVCASTIYTCVYVSVHIDVLNVKQNSEDLIKDMKKTRLWKPVQTCFAAVWRQAARPSIRRAVWIVFNILAPGVVILVAILEVISAHDGMKFMHDCGQDDWNMTLAFYADMGGFAQETSEENHVAEDDEDKMVVRPFRNGQAFLKWYADQGRRFTKGQISRFKDEIHDRSDADSLLKLLTISQAAWFFVETMVRFAELRVVSQLEVATCAYIFCTTIAYCCWASKPYHIQGHIILPEHLKGPKTTTEESTDRPRLESRRTSTSTALNLEKGQPQLTPELPIMLFDKDVRFTPFNRSYRHPNRSWILASVASGVVGALVGAIHGAPLWNAVFVNTHGQWLWRTGSIVQFALPLAIASSAFIERFYSGPILLIIMSMLSFLYNISQLVLFGLIWLSFWSLPISVYKDVDWSWAYFPHWH